MCLELFRSREWHLKMYNSLDISHMSSSISIITRRERSISSSDATTLSYIKVVNFLPQIFPPWGTLLSESKSRAKPPIFWNSSRARVMFFPSNWNGLSPSHRNGISFSTSYIENRAGPSLENGTKSCSSPNFLNPRGRKNPLGTWQTVPQNYSPSALWEKAPSFRGVYFLPCFTHGVGVSFVTHLSLMS